MVDKKQPTPNTVINSVLIHQSTLPHLDVIERAILDCLLQQGRAKIIPDEREAQ